MKLLLFTAVSLCGCASTRIDTPWGVTYQSTKDVALHLRVELDPATQQLKILEIDWGGQASPVVMAQGEAFGRSFGLAAGTALKAALSGVTP